METNKDIRSKDMQSKHIRSKHIRSKRERQSEIKPIILKLNELHLSPISYPSIKELYTCLQDYIQNGERKVLSIPFPEYNSVIKGVLEININERVWVKIESIKI
jgi:hypothetical protein